MKTKLTLNIEETVIHKIKALSQKKSQSISAMVEGYFNSIIEMQKKKKVSTTKKELTYTEQFRKKFPITTKWEYNDEEMDKMRYDYLKKKHG